MLCSGTLTQSGVGVNSSCGGTSIGDTCMVFCAEGHQAVSHDTSTLTCAYNSSDNTVEWKGEVPLCLVVTCDVIAPLTVDFSERFNLTCNETCVVHRSVGYTGVGDKNTPEFIGESDGHLQGSMECAEESLELSTVRVLAERVFVSDDQFVQRDGDMSGTQVQTTAACSLWEKGRVGQPSRKWQTKRFCNIKWRVSVVSYEVVHALNQRAGGWESPQQREYLVSNLTSTAN